jgi:hypothetical protein
MRRKAANNVRKENRMRQIARPAVPARGPLVLVLLLAALTLTAQEAAKAAAADSRVSALRAGVSPDGQGIELLFRSSNPAREILVFWGTAPMRGAEDLLRSTSKMQLDAGQTRCLVPVLAGVDFYFALLDAEAYKLGRAVLVPGENSTERPFRVPLGQAVADFAPAPALRPFPLPTLDAGVGVQSGLALQAPSAPAVPAPRNVSAETVRAIGDLRASLGPQQPVRLVPQLLPVDQAAAVTEEGKGLKLIVQGPFTAGDMPEAERQIRNFLSLARTRDTEARARFYLGQVLYYQDRPREAYLEFLVAGGILPAETTRWKTACLEASADSP